MTSSQILERIDSFASVRSAIGTLDGFHELVQMRMEYAHEFKGGEFGVPMKDWVVMNGLFLLTKDGRVAVAVVDGVHVTEPVKDSLPVMRFQTFRNNLPHIRFAPTRLNFIPMDDCKCSICRKGWGTHDCRNVVVRSSQEYIVFNAFAGRELVHVLDEHERKTGMKYFTQWLVDENNKRIEPRLSSTVRPGMKGNFEAIWFRHPQCMHDRAGKVHF